MAYCKYCNKEVTWMQEGRKKVPVESDGTTHSCNEFKDSLKSIRQINVSNLDPEIIKQYEQAINKKKK